MSQIANPSRALGATCMLAVVLAWASPEGQAAPIAAAQAVPAPQPFATELTPRALLASPLVTIERIDGLGAGVLQAPGATGPGGEVPTYLLDPDGFTTFGQVAPPDGGHLIMLVE